MSALGRKALFDDDDDPLFSSSAFSSSSSSSSSSSATISSSSSSDKNGGPGKGLFDDETENDTLGVGVDPLKVEEPALAAIVPPQPSSGGSALRGVDPSKVKLKAAKVESTRGSGEDGTETNGSKLDTNTRMGLGVDFSDRLHAEQPSASGDSGSASSLSFLDDLLTAEDSKAFEATATMKSSTSGLAGDIPATTTPAFTGTDPASVVERKTNLLLGGDEDEDEDDKNLEGLTMVGKLLEREAGSDAALFGSASEAEQQVEQNAQKLLGRDATRDARKGLDDDDDVGVDDALLSKLEAVTTLSGGTSVGASTAEPATSPSLSATKKASLGDLLAGTAGDGEGLDLVGNEADFDFDSYINSAAEESNDGGGLFG